MDFTYAHIRYFNGYGYNICLQDTIQLSQLLCLLCQIMLLPMPVRLLLLTKRSGLSGSEVHLPKPTVYQTLCSKDSTLCAVEVLHVGQPTRMILRTLV